MQNRAQDAHSIGIRHKRRFFTPPNIITLCRIPLSIALLFFNINSAPFFICYILCGATDIADGIVACKLHMQTKAGATLDSVCDGLFAVVMAVVFLPTIMLTPAIIISAILIVVIRALSLIIRLTQHKQALLSHNLPNRIAGLLIFIFLPLYAVFTCYAFVIICIAAGAVSALFELYSTVTKKTMRIG